MKPKRTEPRLSPVAAAIGAAAEEAAGWPTMLAGTVTQAEASLLADWLIYLRAGVLLREQDAHYALRIYRHVRAEELRATASLPEASASLPEASASLPEASASLPEN